MINPDFTPRMLAWLSANVDRVLDADFTPLMLKWGDIIDEDNRRGVLAGLDKDGNPLDPVTYRPKRETLALTRAQRLGQRKNAKFGASFGFGPAASGLHNNLSRSEYEKLDGPPLAPRRQFSRVITNLETGYNDGRIVVGVPWEAFGAWRDVVSTKGQPFLPAHFKGEGRLPVRNLAGVRPQGKVEARRAAVAFVRKLIRTLG